MKLAILTLALFGAIAPDLKADTVVAVRMIRAQTVLGPDDIALRPGHVSGALEDPVNALGLEARVNIYAGRPLRSADLGPPAVVSRNQLIHINYFHAGLAIATSGRALDRGGVGELIRVMNESSRTTVTGVVMSDGSVSVAPFHKN